MIEMRHWSCYFRQKNQCNFHNAGVHRTRDFCWFWFLMDKEFLCSKKCILLIKKITFRRHGRKSNAGVNTFRYTRVLKRLMDFKLILFKFFTAEEFEQLRTLCNFSSFFYIIKYMYFIFNAIFHVTKKDFLTIFVFKICTKKNEYFRII